MAIPRLQFNKRFSDNLQVIKSNKEIKTAYQNFYVWDTYHPEFSNSKLLGMGDDGFSWRLRHILEAIRISKFTFAIILEIS